MSVNRDGCGAGQGWREAEFAKGGTQGPDAGVDEGLEMARAVHFKAWESSWDSMDGINAAISRSMELLRGAREAFERGNREAAKAAFKEVCWQMFPVAPKATTKAAMAVDPSWSPSDPMQGPGAVEGVECALQFDGRTVGRVWIPNEVDERRALEHACEKVPRFAAMCREKEAKRLVFKPGKVLNFVP